MYLRFSDLSMDAVSNHSRRRLLRCAGGTLLGAGVASRSASAETTTEITIIHDSYFNGLYNDAEDPDNIATYFGLVDMLRERAPNPLVLGKGNDLSPSVMTTLFDGAHVIDAMNAGDIEYTTFGNHDFDRGPENAAEMVDRSEFPWVTANVTDRDTGGTFAADSGAERYALHDIGGVTVGITGLLTDQAPELTSLGDDVEVSDAVEAASTVVPEMREAGADVTIALSHLNQPRPEEVAREVSCLDLLIGDRTATVLEEPVEINGTLLSFVGSEFDHVGELALAVDDGEVVGHEFTLHTLVDLVEANEVDPHPEVFRLLECYNGILERELDVVIGETTEPLDATRETLRRHESNFGNLVADTIRDVAGTEIGLMNSGGMRTDTRYEAGPITRRLVANVLPFPNTVVRMEVTGNQLEAALENGVSQVDVEGATGTGRFPQVSGLSFAYDPTQESGNRLVDVRVGDEPVDSEATYTLGTNDFVAGGGDGYEVFADLETTAPAADVPLLSTIVINRIQNAGTVSPTTDGRIEVVGEDEVRSRQSPTRFSIDRVNDWTVSPL